MRPPLTLEYLEQKHYREHLTQREIAVLTGWSRASVTKAFRKHGVKCTLRRVGHKAVEDFFDHWTPEMAYILGFTICDGCVLEARHSLTTGRRTARQLVYTIQAADVAVLHYIRKHICPTVTIHTVQRKGRHPYTDRVYEHVMMRFYCPRVIDSIAQHGVVPRKTGKEIVPNRLPDELLPHFVRGVIDGDGCISMTYDGKGRLNPRLQITSASVPFLAALNQRWLNGVGKIVKHRGHYNLILNRREVMLAALEPVYRKGFCLERKREKYCEVLAYHLRMADNPRSQRGLKARNRIYSSVRQSALNSSCLAS
jgi:hypothetical protein